MIGGGCHLLVLLIVGGCGHCSSLMVLICDWWLLLTVAVIDGGCVAVGAGWGRLLMVVVEGIGGGHWCWSLVVVDTGCLWRVLVLVAVNDRSMSSVLLELAVNGGCLLSLFVVFFMSSVFC